ncbi:MAG: hypothetical protein IKN54_07640, partial [Lachnospiraceae bacterium]|nr:hypothetical protein [Lachnospiraceae bacterium]
SIQIKDTKNFMNELLVKNTFDFFNLYEAIITTYCTFTIDGHIQQSYYSSEELELLDHADFAGWSQLKPVCFNLIKGNKTPELLKITLCLPGKNYAGCIERSMAPITEDNITGLYVHIVYEHGTINVITATSLNIFTMDKSLDHYWDNTIKTFLTKHFDVNIE